MEDTNNNLCAQEESMKNKENISQAPLNEKNSGLENGPREKSIVIDPTEHLKLRRPLQKSISSPTPSERNSTSIVHKQSAYSPATLPKPQIKSKPVFHKQQSEYSPATLPKPQIKSKPPLARKPPKILPLSPKPNSAGLVPPPISPKPKKISLTPAATNTLSKNDIPSESTSALPESTEITQANSVIDLSKSPKEDKITYPMSILRRTPKRPSVLKSCSDLMMAVEQSEDFSEPNSAKSSMKSKSEYLIGSDGDVSMPESSQMIMFKKFKQVLKNKSMPYQETGDLSDSDCETSSAEIKPEMRTKSKSKPELRSKSKSESSDGEDTSRDTSPSKFKKNPAAPSHNRLVLKRSNAFYKKDKVSPTSSTERHSSTMANRSEYSTSISSQYSTNSVFSTYTEKDFSSDEESSSSSDKDDSPYEIFVLPSTFILNKDKLTEKEGDSQTFNDDDLNFDFPPIPVLPHPRLEMNFESPCDFIRRFLATHRGPSEVFPVPRKSERGGRAIKKLEAFLHRLSNT